MLSQSNTNLFLNGDVVYKHDLIGNFTFINEVGERILGYSCEEVCRMNVVEFVAPGIAKHVREQIVDTVTAKIGTVYEVEIIAKDGSRVPLEVSTRVVAREGHPVEIEGIAVPTVPRGAPLLTDGQGCVDEDFFYLVSS